MPVSIRPITADDIRCGMDVARNKHRYAPDKGLLTTVARMALERMLDNMSHRDAVKAAYAEVGIENSARYLYWTALAPILSRYTNLIQMKTAMRPPMPKRLPSPNPESWRIKLLHQTSARRMAYQRRDHLLPEHDR